MEVYEKDTRKHRPLILKLPSILVWKTGKKKRKGGRKSCSAAHSAMLQARAITGINKGNRTGAIQFQRCFAPRMLRSAICLDTL